MVFQNLSSRNLTGAGLKAALGGTHTHTTFGNISAGKITADSISINQGSEAQSVQLMEALVNGSNSVTIAPSDALSADHTLLITDSGLLFDGAAIGGGGVTAHNDLTGRDATATHPATSITGLATVATSGSYADLSNQPTIPNAATQIAYGSSTVGATLDLLAPAPPAALSSRTLSIASTYTARESGTGTVRSGVINTTTPTITASGAFGDGNAGTLSALIDSGTSGSRVLSTADDTGTYTSLQILTDLDPYAGVFGQQGFYKQLTARIVPSPAVAVKTAHTAQLSHTSTGSTPALTWYSDDAVTPSASTPVVSGVTHTSGKHVSGVECLTTGDTIQISSTATNAVNSFYNNSQILRFTAAYVTTLNYLPGTPPADNASVASGTQNVVVASGYSAGAQITATAYNSAGGTGTATLTSNVRIDSASNESVRKLSGAGDYPATGYGGTYDTTQLLTGGDYLNELQMINGYYQYPPATNYTGQLPAGPNYSTGLGTEYRWVTFAFTGFSGTGRTITITSPGNFGSNAIIPYLKMYARVDGSSPTAGWVDLNAAYDLAIPNPTANGDPALAPGSTTGSRILTLGSVVRTGTLYIRIGLPAGSTKIFTGAS